MNQFEALRKADRVVDLFRHTFSRPDYAFAMRDVIAIALEDPSRNGTATNPLPPRRDSDGSRSALSLIARLANHLQYQGVSAALLDKALEFTNLKIVEK